MASHMMKTDTMRKSRTADLGKSNAVGTFSKCLVCSTQFWLESRRDLTTNCGDHDTTPVTRVNTSGNLVALRSVMTERGVDAYIVPLDDEGRREWISGFTGSNGDCIVTMELVRSESLTSQR